MALDLTPQQEWWTAQELADAALPDLPTTKRRVQDHINKNGWADASGLMRRRAGRGGGFEYHWSLLPRRAQARLIREAHPAELPAQTGADWAAYDRLSATAKGKAAARVEALVEVETLERAGHTAHQAVSIVSEMRGTGYSERSIWAWRTSVRGVDRSDWLPVLAPRHATAARRVVTAEMHPDAWEFFKADYLRLGEPTLEACWRRVQRAGRTSGWAVPCQKTLKRLMDRTVSKPAQVLAREGWDALKRLYPPQERDKSHLHALHSVEADYHKWDVFVEWDGEIVRPQMVAFRDVYSGKLLSFRFEKTACWSGVQQAFGEMIEEFGIPQAVYLDNGREFATKQFTGGTHNRFRFTHSDDDVPGILMTLGIETYFTKPYSGQSKTIERTFRDYAGEIAKDPRFQGAYVGNRPDAKPENYGSKAIPMDRFMEVVAEGIAEHNARTGRAAAVAGGRSFDETFAASFATAPIRRATAEQRRLWLMGAKGLHADSTNGQLRFMGARFWAPWMSTILGQKVIGRFDPMKLDAGMHVYSFDNRYLGEAECVEPGKYNSLEDARRHEKARAAYRRAVVAERDAARRLDIAAVGRMLDDVGSDAPAPAPAQARVVRPEFGRQREMPRQREASPDEVAARAATVARIEDAARHRDTEVSERDRAMQRFRDAMTLEQEIAAGNAVDPEQRDWLRIYQAEPEYRAFAKLRLNLGDAVFG